MFMDDIQKYNNIFLLKKIIALKDSLETDDMFFGRVLVYLCNAELRPIIDHDLASKNVATIPWYNENLALNPYSIPLIRAVIIKCGLANNQPFNEAMNRTEMNKLVPLIHVLCPGAIHNMQVALEINKSMKRNTNLDHIKKNGFSVGSLIVYRPKSRKMYEEFGIITEIKDDGTIVYDSVNKPPSGFVEAVSWGEALEFGICRPACSLERVYKM